MLFLVIFKLTGKIPINAPNRVGIANRRPLGGGTLFEMGS